MESSRVVVDTNIFIDYLRAKDKKNTELFEIPDDNEICISSITLYELLMGATNEKKRKDVQLLTKGLSVLPFDEDISVLASDIYHRLRKSNKMIEFRDIFIAATCLAYDLPIKTSNKNHFQRIEGLKFR
ncbi:MAG: type II toxin-antitoxin system VapC family toxin [Mangrovibacterium sp.]|nr:type II toxin-antitoxin system VapC family toxin [Mangrovibacterium sp.]